jgi:hypothetical protein
MSPLPIDMVLLPLLFWGSLFALLYIRDWIILQRVAPTGPAAQKAEALIREWLRPEQLRDYDKRKRFKVTGSAGGHYLIAPGSIRDLDTGRHICFVPENWTALPVADVMLARKIALENDEAGVLEVAFRG